MSLTEERETLLRPNRKHEIRIITLFWQFVEFSLLWRFLTVCGFVQVACQGFLGKLVSVFWWVELDYFSLECNEVSSNEL